jgi:hypothetical protein
MGEHIRLQGRSWSGSAIILLGYVLAFVFGAFLSQIFARRLEQVSQRAVPATLVMDDMRSTYARVVGLYGAAVVDGEPAHLVKTRAMVGAFRC